MISGGVPTENITIVIAIYGALLSTVLAYLTYKENKIDVRVTISKIIDEDPLSDGEPPKYTISVRNFGRRIANIDSIRLKLQCAGKEYQFRSLKTFKDGLEVDISIPCELLPGYKLETSVDYWEIYKFVENNHKYHVEGDPYYQNFDLDLKKLSSCKLIAYFEDQLGKIIRSNSIYI